MRASLLLRLLCSAFLGLMACKDNSPVSCDTSADCSQAGIPGTCLPSSASTEMWCAFPDTTCPAGNRWGILSGDGLASMCVSGVLDGGIDAPWIDAGHDAGGDADMADAAVDAGPGQPPVSNGQSASLILGQSNFTTGTENTNGESLQSFATPTGISILDGRLWVSESGNARVLQWNSLPVVNRQAANLVLGQLSASMHTDGLTQELLGNGNGKVFWDGTHLVASDTGNNRVLIWNGVPTSTGEPADQVLGQATFTTSSSGTGATQFSGPHGIWSDGTRLAITDVFNSRVLIWTSFPTANGQAADLVLGRPSFGVGGNPPPPASASTLARPRGVYFDGSRFYVADSDNHRVLAWNGFPTTNGESADLVVGQQLFENGGANGSGASVSEFGLKGPYGVTVAFGSLFICDHFNARVLVYSPIPTSNGEAADAVLGRPNFTAGDLPAGALQANLGACRDLAVVDQKLFVVDSFFHRVLRYDLHP